MLWRPILLDHLNDGRHQVLLFTVQQKAVHCHTVADSTLDQTDIADVLCRRDQTEQTCNAEKAAARGCILEITPVREADWRVVQMEE